jgi:3-oxoacyl-[acyl-carrier protein] reductase/7-alpha-hydroxysteroid dehydrogenase
MDSIYNYDPASFDNVIKLNVNAVFYAIRAVAPIMKENGGGVILNTSSMVSLHGQPAGVAYPTSKFALNGMTKSLARELAKDNIRVNAVAPGVTDTDMVANLPEQVREGIKKTIPLGRIGTPEDVAEAFLYLASDKASYVTGEILSVDGCARS